MWTSRKFLLHRPGAQNDPQKYRDRDSVEDEITMVDEVRGRMYHLDVFFHSLGDVLNVDAIRVFLRTM